VPYKKNVKNGDRWEEVWTVQWLPMVEGVRKMLWESAGIILHTKVVYARDEYDYQEGLVDNPIFHRPLPGPRSASDIVAVYSIAKFPDGRRDWDWMWKEEIEQVRSKSRAGDSGPWNDPVFYPEMAIKTVVHHHGKALPLSSKTRRTIERGGDLLDGAVTRAVPAERLAEREEAPALTYDTTSPFDNASAPAQRSVDAVMGAMARGEPVQQPATRRRRRQEPQQASEAGVRASTGTAGSAGGAPDSGFGITYTPGSGGANEGVAGGDGGGGGAVGGMTGGTTGGMTGGGTGGNDRIVLRDPDGTTYYKDTGDPKRAREWLQKGLEASPDAKALSRRLAELNAAQRKKTSKPAD